MVLSRLALVTPVTTRSGVAGVVLAAVFEGDDMVELPTVSRPEFPFATVADAASLQEQTGSLLIGEPLAELVSPRVQWGHVDFWPLQATTIVRRLVVLDDPPYMLNEEY